MQTYAEDRLPADFVGARPYPKSAGKLISIGKRVLGKTRFPIERRLFIAVGLQILFVFRQCRGKDVAPAFTGSDKEAILGGFRVTRGINGA